MGTIGSIAAWLNDLGVPYEFDADSIQIPASCEEGFAVRIVGTGNGYEVWCEGWHEHDVQPEHLIDLVKLLLSHNARLLVKSLKTSDLAYRLELFQENEWRTFSTVGHISLQFWSKPSYRTLQNHWI